MGKKSKNLRDLPERLYCQTDFGALLHEQARRHIWASRQIKRLYETNQLSLQDCFRLLAKLDALERLVTEEIQDLVEDCIAACTDDVESRRTYESVIALHEAYPHRPINEAIAIEKVFAGIKTGFPTSALVVTAPHIPHKVRMRAPPKVQAGVVEDLLAEGHTQRMIAERLGVHESAVSHALRRAGRRPRWEQRRKQRHSHKMTI